MIHALSKNPFLFIKTLIADLDFTAHNFQEPY